MATSKDRKDVSPAPLHYSDEWRTSKKALIEWEGCCSPRLWLECEASSSQCQAKLLPGSRHIIQADMLLRNRVLLCSIFK